jgi:hypothetical protein
MALDSKAVFLERVTSLGLGAFSERFVDLGWTSYGELAFATSYTPGQPEDERFKKEVLEAGLGQADHPKKSALRRLFFEAYTMAAADLKRRIETTGDEGPRRVPAVERYERRERVAARLLGLSLDGELDVSNRLLDQAIGLYEDNTVQYIAWSEATKREMELRGEKKDKSWAADAAGVLRERVVSTGGRADTSSDLKLSFALRRRGLAFEMADIMSYHTHELLVSKLLAAYLRDPMPGFAPVTLEQLARADQEAFRLLARATTRGIKRNEHNHRPCDTLFPDIIASPDVYQVLMCMPRAGGGGAKRARSATPDGDAKGGIPKKSKRSARQARAREALQGRHAAELQEAWKGGGGKGRGKGKDQGKGKGAGGHMPPGLIGKCSTAADGRRICFSFNLPGGCAGAAVGAQCPRGWHICAEPGCHLDHTIQGAHDRPWPQVVQ